MKLACLVPVLLLAACGLGEVRVVGVAVDSPDDKSSPLVDGEVTILDSRGLEFDRASTDSSGRFDVAAPPGEVIYALVGNADDITASFTGVSGLDPVMRIERGDLFGVPASVREAWSEQFDGCEGFDEGGLVIGQVHVFLPGVEPEDSTIVNNATASLQRADSGATLDLPSCYLDAETGRYDPEAEQTGRLGWYAIPNVPAGQYTLVIRFAVTDTRFQNSFLDVRVPPDGVVPRLPTFVEFPQL